MKYKSLGHDSFVNGLFLSRKEKELVEYSDFKIMIFRYQFFFFFYSISEQLLFLSKRNPFIV